MIIRGKNEVVKLENQVVIFGNVSRIVNEHSYERLCKINKELTREKKTIKNHPYTNSSKFLCLKLMNSPNGVESVRE